jgi:tripartite-type tricarboxylate transporter receptor subunit TctC
MNVILASFLGMMVCVAANAQSWPGKPVRVIVNVAPGGVADVTMRVLGARLTETLGQPFLVENRAGGDGYIGFEAVGRAEPDGYTMLYSPGSSMMIAPHIVDRPDLDPTKVLTPVVPTGRVSLYVLTHPNCRSARQPSSLPTRAPTRESSATVPPAMAAGRISRANCSIAWRA